MNEQKEQFEEWAIVELFGHSQIAGLVSEQSIGGNSFIRVDVPAVNDSPPFTKFYGGAAIYAMTPCSKATATIAAKRLTVRPVSQWIVPTERAPMIEPPSDVEIEEDDIPFDYDSEELDQ